MDALWHCFSFLCPIWCTALSKDRLQEDVRSGQKDWDLLLTKPVWPFISLHHHEAASTGGCELCYDFSCKEQRASSSALHTSSCNLPLVTDTSETACQGQGSACGKMPHLPQEPLSSRKTGRLFSPGQRSRAVLVSTAARPLLAHLCGLGGDISGSGLCEIYLGSNQPHNSFFCYFFKQWLDDSLPLHT